MQRAIPPDNLKTEECIKAAVDSTTYFGKLFAYPSTSSGGIYSSTTQALLRKPSLHPPCLSMRVRATCQRSRC